VIHLGGILSGVLKPLGGGQFDAAKQLGVSLHRLKEIALGKRGITRTQRCG
jgi:plasmid maintenance system antidote protein VapI